MGEDDVDGASHGHRALDYSFFKFFCAVIVGLLLFGMLVICLLSVRCRLAALIYVFRLSWPHSNLEGATHFLFLIFCFAYSKI